MIRDILILLKDTPILKSEIIDEAKGKYKLPSDMHEFKNQLKWQSKRK